MRPVEVLSKCLTVLLLISPVTVRAETEASGCELLPDARIACSAVFMRQLAEGYQHARAGAKICDVKLHECRETLALPAPTPAEPPISGIGALVVGGTSGIALAAGVAVLIAGGPVEVGAGLAGAGGAGLTAGAVVLAW